MTAWICATCAVQHPEADRPPAGCAICEDERQYVGAGGQRWLAPEELRAAHPTYLREQEPDMVGICTEPTYALGQRALLVRTPHGNVLWDCIPVFDDNAAEKVAELGGIAAIGLSHPHFHGVVVEWAEHFDAPILVPRVDADWIRRPSRHFEFFDDRAEPVPGVTLIRVGGHFDGSVVLHWTGADGRGVLLTGDSIQVVPDPGWVTFMYSYPNLLPLDAGTVTGLAERLAPFRFERLRAGWWDRCVESGADAAVARSAERYAEQVRGERAARRPSRVPGE